MTITDYNNTLLKTVSIIVYNPLKKLEFTEKQYECAPYGEDCEYIELITKPDPCDKPIRLEYNKKLVEVEDCYDGTYKVLLLTDKPAEIKAISATGLEAVCEIIPYEDDDY